MPSQYVGLKVLHKVTSLQWVVQDQCSVSITRVSAPFVNTTMCSLPSCFYNKTAIKCKALYKRLHIQDLSNCGEATTRAVVVQWFLPLMMSGPGFVFSCKCEAENAFEWQMQLQRY